MKLAGIFGENCQEQTIKAMAKAQIRAQLNNSEVFKVTGGFLAKITTATGTTGNICLYRTGSTQNILIIAGLPIIINGNLEQKLNQIVELDYQNAAEALTEFDGAFAALYWDQIAGKLIIVTDILGMQPLYMARVSGRLLVASEMKAIAASRLIEVEMNPSAWGSFITFGHTLGNETALKRVQRVAPGAVLIYDPSSDRLEEKKYWHWPEPQLEKNLANVDTGQIVELLEQNIKAYLPYHQAGTILLSGGFDSRLLLAVLNKLGVYPLGIILTHEDELLGADGIYGEWVAKKLGISVRRVFSDPNFFSSQAYLDYLVTNEVATPSLFLFISQVLQHLEPSMGAVWEGCFPTILAAKQPRGGFSEYLALLAMSPTSPQWRAVKKVFAPPLARGIQEAFLESLEAERSRYSDDGFGVSQFIARHRTRNRTAPNPLKVYPNVVPIFTPGLTKDFWAIAAALSFEVKREFRLYKQIFQEHFPKMLTVPFVSGGKLISPQGFSLGYLAFKKAHQLQLALNKGKVGRGLLKVWGSLAHQRFFQSPQFLGQVIARVDTGHDDLNCDEVRLIQDFTRSNPNKLSYEQRLLFYWQVWRWVMDGKGDLSEVLR
ncbi:MAG: hypothetical protein MGG37_05270 [Trichodesmium sp. MAG_R01]|nr:hypothetical protein [Trichodesmium sp. MAG_R01]